MPQEWTIHELPGTRILEYPREGALLGRVSSSLDIIAAARGQRAGWVAVPIERLGDTFFQLHNGIAGEMLQKFATYQLHVAIVGDTAALSGFSKAMHDLIVECNRGSDIWFVPDLDELKQRLAQAAEP